ncbi:MAG: Tex family protein [Cyclobacteriaceae bacterium]
MSSELASRWFTKISQESTIPLSAIKAVAGLLDDGATIPFIARYRKEQTGSLDEVQLGFIRDRLNQLRELDKRREAIISSIEKQGKLTPELMGAIINANSIAELEDIYLPFRPKRKTRASVAREKGLEPLSLLLLKQGPEDPSALAESFINENLGVNSSEDALAGARDIIAEIIAEDIACRKEIRELFQTKGLVATRILKGKEQEGQKFRDYFDWKEPVLTIPSHRMLAIRRAEKEEVITFSIEPPTDLALEILKGRFVHNGPSSPQVMLAAEDGYERLLRPSMETEIRVESKMKADIEAIRVFSENLRKLLLSAPLGQKNVMAIDPGFRTGCKVVCLDRQGKLLNHTVIYPNEPKKDRSGSAETIKKLCEQFRIDAIAIGNGTAGRETESFVKNIGLSQRIQIVVVNESGASVYSASEAAREEFPDQDITVRGAVSIGRRLMDPLSLFVKFYYKSIGVLKYQHDVDQNQLKSGLDDIVISCVNAVGVEVNTASKELLSYVSGIGPSLAKSIIDYRNEHGPFSDRNALMAVNRFGEKVFEQAAGFLRIRESGNPLDASAVHPESYPIVDKMATDLGCSVKELIGSAELRKKLDLNKYVDTKVGLPTLEDILKELEKPGRDPREHFDPVVFAEGVHTLQDLKIGMKLPGVVTNVTAFGAFVDIGVHQDGLVHISHLSDQFVKDPAAIVSVQQKVEVTVVELDIDRKRIGLSMKANPFETQPAAHQSKSGKPQKHHPGKNPSKPFKDKKPDAVKEQSIEEKLAQLLKKYQK